ASVRARSGPGRARRTPRGVREHRSECASEERTGPSPADSARRKGAHRLRGMVAGRLARHEAWMRRALEVARTAPSTGDVPVGAVVYGPSGEELAAAHNEREARGDPT